MGVYFNCFQPIKGLVLTILTTSLLVFAAPTKAEAQENQDIDKAHEVSATEQKPEVRESGEAKESGLTEEAYEAYEMSIEEMEQERFESGEAEAYRLAEVAQEAEEARHAAMVKTNGFELLVGVGYLAVLGQTQESYDYDDWPSTEDFDWSSTHHTISFTLSAGYRWDWIGLYVDQTLGSVTDDNDTHFLGTSILSAKYFCNITEDVELWGQTGLGAVIGFFGLAIKVAAGLSFKITDHIFAGTDLAYTLAIGWGAYHLPSFSTHLRFFF